ncbi:protoheme IX farnesyltransferase [Rhodobacteraceae bacterium Araon29]|jgi:protoheme IX farnesyltransferase|tara:strand:- start:8507 stop:9445 length:939 start_codon:yes stop_codon:yes gene_type:complete
MSDTTSVHVGTTEAQFGDYFALLKPRVMALVVFTAFVGLLAAPVGVHPFVGLVSVLFIAIGGGASGALNMWWDADIDRVMKRTSKRPIPAGLVSPEDAKALGFALSGFSVVMLGLAANWFAAGFLAFTIFFYVVIYTIWLKRSTPQNIVIGGAAGAFPPMIGWAVATGGVSVEGLLMFALIFMWTPPHFWALALFLGDDYDNADVPMLTVTHGRRTTRVYILVYTVLLALIAVGTGFSAIGGLVYLSTAIVLNIWFVIGAVKIWRRSEADSAADQFLVERKFFKLSLFYLFALFLAILFEAGLDRYGLGGML